MNFKSSVSASDPSFATDNVPYMVQLKLHRIRHILGLPPEYQATNRDVVIFAHRAGFNIRYRIDLLEWFAPDYLYYLIQQGLAPACAPCLDEQPYYPSSTSFDYLRQTSERVILINEGTNERVIFRNGISPEAEHYYHHLGYRRHVEIFCPTENWNVNHVVNNSLHGGMESMTPFRSQCEKADTFQTNIIPNSNNDPSLRCGGINDGHTGIEQDPPGNHMNYPDHYLRQGREATVDYYSHPANNDGHIFTKHHYSHPTNNDGHTSGDFRESMGNNGYRSIPCEHGINDDHSIRSPNKTNDMTVQLRENTRNENNINNNSNKSSNSTARAILSQTSDDVTVSIPTSEEANFIYIENTPEAIKAFVVNYVNSLEDEEAFKFLLDNCSVFRKILHLEPFTADEVEEIERKGLDINMFIPVRRHFDDIIRHYYDSDIRTTFRSKHNDDTPTTLPSSQPSDFSSSQSAILPVATSCFSIDYEEEDTAPGSRGESIPTSHLDDDGCAFPLDDDSATVDASSRMVENTTYSWDGDVCSTTPDASTGDSIMVGCVEAIEPDSTGNSIGVEDGIPTWMELSTMNDAIDELCIDMGLFPALPSAQTNITMELCRVFSTFDTTSSIPLLDSCLDENGGDALPSDDYDDNFAKVDDGMLTLPIVNFQEGEVEICSTSIKREVEEHVAPAGATQASTAGNSPTVGAESDDSIPTDYFDAHDVIANPPKPPPEFGIRLSTAADTDVTIALEGAPPTEFGFLPSTATDIDVVIPPKPPPEIGNLAMLPKYGDEHASDGTLPPVFGLRQSITTETDVVILRKYEDSSASDGAPPSDFGIFPVATDDVINPSKYDENNPAPEGALSPEFDDVLPIDANDVISYLPRNGGNLTSPQFDSILPNIIDNDVVYFPTNEDNSAPVDMMSDEDVVLPACKVDDIVAAPSTSTADAVPEGDIHRDNSTFGIDTSTFGIDGGKVDGDIVPAPSTSKADTVPNGNIISTGDYDCANAGIFIALATPSTTTAAVVVPEGERCESFDGCPSSTSDCRSISTTTAIVSEGELHALFDRPLTSNCCNGTTTSWIDDVAATTSTRMTIAITKIAHRASFDCLSSTSEHGTTWIDDILAKSSTAPPIETILIINHRKLFGCPSSTSSDTSTINHRESFDRPSLTSDCGTTHFDNISAEKPPITMNSINHRDLLGCLSSNVSVLGCPSSNSDFTICIGGTTTASDGEIDLTVDLCDGSSARLYDDDTSCMNMDTRIFIALVEPSTTTADSEGPTFQRLSTLGTSCILAPERVHCVSIGCKSSTSNTISTINHHTSFGPSSNSDCTICIGGTTVAPKGYILSKFVLRDDNGFLLYNNSRVKVDDGILITPEVPSTTSADSEGSTFQSSSEHHQVLFGSITTTSTESITLRCSSTFGIDGTISASEGKHHVLFGFLPSSSISSCVTSLIVDALAKKSTGPTTATTTMNINSPTSTTGITRIGNIFAKKPIEPSIATTTINDDYFSTATVGTFMVVIDNTTLGRSIPLLCPSSWKTSADDNGIRWYTIDDGLGETPQQLPTTFFDQHGTTADNCVVIQGATTLKMVEDSAVCLSNADSRIIILGTVQDSDVFLSNDDSRMLVCKADFNYSLSSSEIMQVTTARAHSATEGVGPVLSLVGTTTVHFDNNDHLLHCKHKRNATDTSSGGSIVVYSGHVLHHCKSMQFHARTLLRNNHYLNDGDPTFTSREHCQMKYHWILEHSTHLYARNIAGIVSAESSSGVVFKCAKADAGMVPVPSSTFERECSGHAECATWMCGSGSSHVEVEQSVPRGCAEEIETRGGLSVVRRGGKENH